MQALSGHQACAITLCFLVTAVLCDPSGLKASTLENGTVSVNRSNYGKLIALEYANEQSKVAKLSERETQQHTEQIRATHLADSGIDSCLSGLDQEAPFYFLAFQGTVKLFISDWAFPVHGWRGPLSKGQFVFASGMNLLAFSTSIRDIRQGFEYLKIAWVFVSIVWPSLAAGAFFFLLWMSVNLCHKEGQPDEYPWSLWLSMGLCLIVPLLGLIFMNYRMSQWATLDAEFFKAVNCSSLIWSSSSQIVSVVQSCAVLKQWRMETGEIHWTRKATLIPWVILNAIFYFPVLTLLLATHLIPAAIEFLPVTFVIANLLVCYSKIVAYTHTKVTERVFQEEQLLLTEAEERQKSWSGWASDVWKYHAHREDWKREKADLHEVRQDLAINDACFKIKAASVPCALVVKFLGEIIVRYRLGSSWWGSVWATWSVRTFGQYTTQLFHSAMSKVYFMQQTL